jgi:hypothetical protein
MSLVRRRLFSLAVSVGLALGLSAPPAPATAQSATAPPAPPAVPQGAAAAAEPVRFAVIGDMGNGSRRQLETARRLWTEHERFPYSFVITVGDNMYGGQDPSDYERKFVLPYKPLIDAQIPFYASLGNHDKRAQTRYPLFNMNGAAFYTFGRSHVQFFALDSTEMTQDQLRWFEAELTQSDALWKIAYFHHPIYSSGLRHGPRLVLRAALEPLLSTFGVQVIFTGHEHFYERLHPRYGIQQFITGSGGQLRRGGLRRGSIETAAGNDTDNVFMLVEVAGDVLRYEAVSRAGEIVDSGTVPVTLTATPR